MKVLASLVVHGRGKRCSRPWRALITAVVRAAHGREQLAISVAKINYNREINKVFLLLLGIRAACSLCRGNKKGKSFLYLVRWRNIVCWL